MSEEEIMELADKVGDVLVTEYGVTSAKIEWLRKFADLVAAREREACAELADRLDPLQDGGIGQAIRARREK